MILPKIVAIGIYNSDLAVKNLKVTKKRTTTMFEIELPIDRGGVSYIDEEELPITPDMIICAKPGQTRHSKLPFKCYYIHMILSVPIGWNGIGTFSLPSADTMNRGWKMIIFESRA